MTDDDILKALRAAEGGWVRHAHPFTWERTPEAEHVDPRTLQRALQQGLIAVDANADRAPRPVRLTTAGVARLARG